MGPLKKWLAAALLAWASPAAADSVTRWDPHVAEASERFAVPAEWIRRVIAAESGGRLTLAGRPIVSRAGAMGLMQLMPGTWAAMRARHGLGANPHDPRDNILAGTAYLRLMYDRFGYPGFFGAYNAGPERYARYLSGRTSLPSETVAYVAAVTGRGITRPKAWDAGGAPPPAKAAPLFVVRRMKPSPQQEVSGSGIDAISPSSSRLFAVELGEPQGQGWAYSR